MMINENDIIELIQESSNQELIESVDASQRLIQEVNEIRNLISIHDAFVLKIMFGIVEVLFAVGIFGIQISMIPISVISFSLGFFILVVFLICFFIYKVPLDSWMDVLSEKDISKINEIIKGKGIQIVESKELLISLSHRYKRMIIETTDSIES